MYKPYRAATLFALCLAAANAGAADLGHGPITFISPFPPGGGTDTVTRLAAKAMATESGWNIVVENKPGAGGNLALESTARAAPDGHTLVMAQVDNVVLNPWLYKKLPYDTFKDFTPVGLVASSPSVFVVLPDSPYRTLADVDAAAKKKPGEITLGIPGIGGTGDLLGHLWSKAAGVQFTHVPYRGWAQAYPDLSSGRIIMYTGSVASLLPQIRGGKVRALAVVAQERSPALPDVPTFVESGFKNIDQTIWYGLMAAGKTPKATVDQLNAALAKALKEQPLIDTLQNSGYNVLGGTPAAMATRYREDYELFGKVVKEAGIPPQ
jgi:tripartite-type tricarboxylate transporter receptor subunit TctC